MDAIDRLFTERPVYGVPKMQAALKREFQIIIGVDHTRRLMRQMGLIAIYPKKSRHTSISNEEHAVYPYLLNGITANSPNHIWGLDITYIRLENGWCYLVAILDWFSRYVVSWELSLTMESEFCITTLTNAIGSHGIPEISNTDQGSQFTDKKFVAVLKEHGTRISMDGRGRCMDNIFTERLWRSLKYEEVYLKSYQDIADARNNIADYFRFYNERRPHQSLNYQTPAEAYYQNKTPQKESQKLQVFSRRSTSILPTSIV